MQCECGLPECSHPWRGSLSIFTRWVASRGEASHCASHPRARPSPRGGAPTLHGSFLVRVSCALRTLPSSARRFPSAKTVSGISQHHGRNAIKLGPLPETFLHSRQNTVAARRRPQARWPRSGLVDTRTGSLARGKTSAIFPEIQKFLTLPLWGFAWPRAPPC